jgi:hypothetical protein
VTEAEWLAGTDLAPLLGFLGPSAGERKLRLFCCACCRRIWDLLTDPRSRRAVEVAERYADGRADERELGEARLGAIGATGRGANQAAWAAYWTANQSAAECTWQVGTAALEAPPRAAVGAARAAGAGEMAAWDAARAAEADAQLRLLRDLFNPFHPFAVAPAWLTWNRGTVPNLARALYEERAFERLPVLADALEDAGCADRTLLDHLRGPGPHVRGCWAVDLLLIGGH